MWRPPTLTLRNGPQPSRIPRSEILTSGEGAEEAGQQVEEDRFAARRLLVAGDRDADRVERRRRRRFDQPLAVGGLVGAAPQHAPELAGEHGAGTAQGDGGEADGGAFRAAQRSES